MKIVDSVPLCPLCGHSGRQQITQLTGCHRTFQPFISEREITFRVKCECGVTYFHTEAIADSARAPTH